MGLLEAANTDCLASGSNAGIGMEGDINSSGRFERWQRKGVLREASHSWYSLCMSDREDKDRCKHSVGRPRVCKNVQECAQGGHKDLLQRRGQEGSYFNDTIRY